MWEWQWVGWNGVGMTIPIPIPILSEFSVDGQKTGQLRLNILFFKYNFY